MNLFNIFNQKETKSQANDKIDYKLNLDKIQLEIHQFIKPLGFKKQGRTFNREIESGLIQVINFQSGKYPIGNSTEIGGLNKNFYGKFTVNIGVCVSELFEVLFPNQTKIFYQEYDCQIRNRLETIINGTDNWWQMDSDITITSKLIIDGLQSKGFQWLGLFESRDKICENWGNTVGTNSPRAKLDAALIKFQTDKKEGTKLIQDYYNQISMESHKDYVFELAEKLDIIIEK